MDQMAVKVFPCLGFCGSKFQISSPSGWSAVSPSVDWGISSAEDTPQLWKPDLEIRGRERQLRNQLWGVSRVLQAEVESRCGCHISACQSSRQSSPGVSGF